MICSVVVNDRASDGSGNSMTGVAFDRTAQLPPPDRDDASASAELVFLGRERHGLVGALLGQVGQLPRRWIEGELVAVACILDCLRTLHDVQSQIERVAAEDVAHVPAAHDHHLEPGLVGDAFEAGRAHLPRGPDREAIAGDDERLAPVDTRPEIGHQVAERTGLPPLIQRVEALGYTVGGRCDLIGIDGVEFAPVSRAGQLGVPEDQRPSANQPQSSVCRLCGAARKIVETSAWPQVGLTDYVHS